MCYFAIGIFRGYHIEMQQIAKMLQFGQDPASNLLLILSRLKSLNKLSPVDQRLNFVLAVI